MDMNQINVIGRLTKDVELRATQNGKMCATLSIAINGYKKEDVIYLEVVALGATAENTNKYTKKGDRIAVSGSLAMDKWQDKATGQARQKIKINANTIQFLESKQNNNVQNNNMQNINNTFNRKQENYDEMPF